MCEQLHWVRHILHLHSKSSRVRFSLLKTLFSFSICQIMPTLSCPGSSSGASAPWLLVYFPVHRPDPLGDTPALTASSTPSALELENSASPGDPWAPFLLFQKSQWRWLAQTVLVNWAEPRWHEVSRHHEHVSSPTRVCQLLWNRKYIDLTFPVPSLETEWDLRPLRNADTWRLKSGRTKMPW